MKEVSSDEMYGIAKKFNAQMDELPMHTHSAICELIRVGMQHRNLAMQKADKDRADAMNQQALDNQSRQIELMKAEHERRAAENLQTTAPGVLTPQ